MTWTWTDKHGVTHAVARPGKTVCWQSTTQAREEPSRMLTCIECVSYSSAFDRWILNHGKA